MPNNALAIDYRLIEDLKPYPGSARTHSRAQKAKLKALLARFGQVVPILIDHDNVIVDGHVVLTEWAALGNDQIAVVVCAGRDPAEIKALRLALGRIPQESGWDKTALKAEFESLLELGFDMDLTGFDAVEIDMALAIDEPSAGEVEDAPPPPSSGPPVAQTGQIWRLGPHKVACGDSRDATLMARLMDGENADLVLTDPPYNVPISGFVVGAGRHREFAFASGEMTPAQFTEFLHDGLAPSVEVLRDGAIAYVFMDWRHLEELLGAVKALKLTMLNLCVWAKSNAGMGSLYRSQHELVFVLKKGAAPHVNNVELGKHGRSRSNVWTYRGMSSFGAERDELLASHPSVKPLQLVADALKDTSRRGDIVLDPFLGSGTTLLSAHRTGRRCRGVEFDPAYVDLIIARWEAETGKDAILASTGETFQACREAKMALAAPPMRLLTGPAANSSAEG
jgi:DNA modification methylase